jgi:SAM-dependent methyltransferase
LLSIRAMKDYTGPQDYFDQEYVHEWEQSANTKRPFRPRFFDAFVAELNGLSRPAVLDLGAGPGFLAEQVLARCDVSAYHLFDFSPHMLELSRARLAPYSDPVYFHQGSFAEEDWWEALPAPFDAVISLQAVHEVRRADRVPHLYRDVGLILRRGGLLLIADLLDHKGDDGKPVLSMSGHQAALGEAGFEDFRPLLVVKDLMMFRARLA